MKNVMRRSFAVLMTLVMCASMLFGLSFSAQAQTVDYVYSGNYIYNWGKRGENATYLSQNAEAFYTDNGTSLSALMTLDGSSTESSVPSSALYQKLQALMKDNHSTVTSYDGTRDLFKYTDCQNSGSPSTISSFYSGVAIGPAWDSGSTWNREHVWPNSKGDKAGDGENDIMMLRPASVSENSSRGNKAFGTTTTTEYYNPNDQGKGNYDLRGDVARIILYQYVRWGCTNTGSDYNSTGIFGADGIIESQEVLLTWVEEDPVDTWELGRNDSVESITGTRNVFVDYPELAFDLFNEDVPTGYTSPSGGNDVEGSTGGDSTDDNTTSTTTTNIVFEFGDNGTASHSDGSAAETYTETVGNYTLTLENLVKCYSGARDATGNSALKLGTGSTVGSFSITVPDDVTSVIFNVAQYKANTTKISVNDTAYTISTASNNGEYTAITVDTTQSKTITFTTVSGGVRCMIDSITYVIAGSSDEGDDSNNTGDDTTTDITGDCYVKVLSSLDDWSGEYLIVYENGSVALNGGLDVLDVASNTIDVTITDNKIPANDATNAAKFTIAKTDDGYTVKSASGYYIGNDAAATNQLSSSNENAFFNTLSFNYTNTSVNVTGAGGYVLQYNSNSGDTRFRYYSGTQKSIALYKLTSAFNGEYTVTAATNNETMGTVSVIDNVVYAAPADGYVVSDYIITSGDATVSQNGDTFTVSATSDVALTVNFVPGDNTVTFVENGTPISTITAKTGETITLPVLDADIFAGWSTEGSTEILTEYTVTGDITFYAQYKSVDDSTQGATGNYYVKVTEAPADWSGTYLIVYEDESMAFNGGLNALDATSNYIAVTIANNQISQTTDTTAAQFTIAAIDGGYTIKSTSGYYVGNTSNANALKSSTSDTYANTISLNSEGNVDIVSSNSYLRFNTTSGQDRFRYYKSSSYTNQKAIALYKLVTVTAAEPTGKILGAQIEIGADLTMNYYVSLTNVADNAQVEMRFTMPEYTDTVVWNSESTVDGKYVFNFNGIPTQCMTDSIDAKLILINDTEETVLDTLTGYSIQQNAINLLATYPDDAALKQLITDMLCYGAASQQYTGYNTDNLATNGVENLGTASTATPDDTDKMTLNAFAVEIGDVYFKGATVWFDAVNKLIIKLNSATENTRLYLDGEQVYFDENYTYTTEGISATDFDTVYKFTLYEGDTHIQTLYYSVNAYAYSKQNSSNEKMANLALALYRYGKSAEAYAESLK